MSGQRARSAIAADHRSALPRVPGIPWWGAVLLAATASAVGFAYDAGSGDKTLSGVFSGLLRRGLPVGGARGSAVGHLHRRHPAAVDPLRRRPGGLLRLPRQQDHRHQGHPDQLRLSADRALPADVLHHGGRAADRHGTLVSGHVGAARRTGGRRRRGARRPQSPRRPCQWPPPRWERPRGHAPPGPRTLHRPSRPRGRRRVDDEAPQRPARSPGGPGSTARVAVPARAAAGDRAHRADAQSSPHGPARAPHRSSHPPNPVGAPAPHSHATRGAAADARHASARHTRRPPNPAARTTAPSGTTDRSATSVPSGPATSADYGALRPPLTNARATSNGSTVQRVRVASPGVARALSRRRRR